MGAHLDHGPGSQSLFECKKVQPKGFGLTGIEAVSWPLTEHRLDDRRKSWSVCPHLSSLEGLFDYYMAAGPILILLGKCLCQDCCEMAVSRSDLTKVMESCRQLTDQEFQEGFIDLLFQINREVFRTRRDSTCEETTRWTWISCPHVSRQGRLEELYTRCNPIFFYQGFLTCNECKEVVPSASLYLQTLLDCEAMTDGQMQARVVDRLYSINRKVLENVGHYTRQGWPRQAGSG